MLKSGTVSFDAAPLAPMVIRSVGLGDQAFSADALRAIAGSSSGSRAADGSLSRDRKTVGQSNRIARHFRSKALTWGVVLLLGLCGSSFAVAAAPDEQFVALDWNTSETTRRDAIRALPFDKLDSADRAKVESVIANVSIFRRMPIKTIECDPDLYLFLVRHPDVVVNIWEVMKISRLQVRQTGPERFQIAESAGTVADVRCLYSSASTHLVYAEGAYQGPLFAREVKGRAVLLLKTGYVRGSDGRYRVTCRLDSFVSIEHGGIELLTKTLHPIIGKTADNNFVQTINFVGSLSRTIESNSRGVQRLANRLEHVSPEVRTQFADLAGDIGQKSLAQAAEGALRGELAVNPEE